MADKEKLAAIRAEVERLKDSCASPIVICDTLLAFIDSMQEEPTDKEFEAALAEEWKGYNDRGAAKVDSLEDNTQELAFAKGFYRGWHYNKEKSVSEDLEKIVEEIAEPTILNAYGTKELARRLRNTICGTSVSEELEDYINKLSKQFPEVSFAKLSRIAVRVAKWQKEQFEKNRLAACDRQTEEEAEREQDFVMGIIENEHRQPTFDDAIKYGMRFQKEQIKEALLSEVLPYFMHGGEADEVVAKLDEVLNQKK